MQLNGIKQFQEERMNIKKLLPLCLGLCLTVSAWAADQAAKEETTPPPAIGALTADQTPPLSTISKLPAPQPQQQQNQSTEPHA